MKQRFILLLTGLLLAGEVGSGIEVDLALVGSILDVLGH